VNLVYDKMAEEHKMKRLRISGIQYAENMYSINVLVVDKFETILPCNFK
jgi:hypothetical protein